MSKYVCVCEVHEVVPMTLKAWAVVIDGYMFVYSDGRKCWHSEKYFKRTCTLKSLSDFE